MRVGPHRQILFAEAVPGDEHLGSDLYRLGRKSENDGLHGRNGPRRPRTFSFLRGERIATQQNWPQVIARRYTREPCRTAVGTRRAAKNALDEPEDPHSKPLGRSRCSLDAGERMAHALDGGEAKNTDGGRPLA